jgi:WhiB family redox-sensing transcriptional regulator
VADLLAPAAQSDGGDPWAAAVCRSGATDPDLWHRNEQQAVRLCAACPMRRPCLRAALVAGEPDGVWGGLTRQQRQDLRRALLNQLGPGEPLEGSAALERAVATFGAGRR